MENKRESIYKGYKRIDFKLKAYTGSVILPEIAVKNRRWIWRAEFLDDFNQADMELVKKGWHLAYYKISDQYGSPEAVQLMSDFYEYVIKEFNLSKKTSIFGFSRGGLYTVNYAVKYPERIASLYLDAPVIDLMSWPRKDKPDNKLWIECLDSYGFTDEEAIEYSKSNLKRAQVIAKNKIPVIMVIGDMDKSVPYNENGKLFKDEYLKTHDDIKVIIKKGCEHHPHSLENPKEIVDFIIKN